MTPEEVMVWFAERDGIAHSATLRAAGCSDYVARTLVSAGMLTRHRRCWLAAPGCAPQRLAAAAVGGRVTCVSAAGLAGLWVPSEPDRVHVALAASRSRFDPTGVRVHWAEGPVPVAATEVREPILNVLFQVARCLEPANAQAVWESALRLKRVSANVLARTKWRSTAAESLAHSVGIDSDSGVETRFVLLMRAIGVDVLQQVHLDGHPVDVLIGKRLVVQLDGYAHHKSARDRRRDLRADARLVLRGYTVLRFDYRQVMFESQYVQDTVRAAIAQGLHLVR